MRTFGKVYRSTTGNLWTIECEPHVALRLKRVFPKVNRSAGRIMLVATSENARDLEWFLERFPMEMSDEDRAALASTAAAHREFGETVGRILSGDYAPREFKLAIPLRGYQKQAAELALQTRGLLVGDDVGTGKTATAIGVLSDPSCRPALVVTLTHLPKQWEAEIKRFMPEARVHVLKKGTPYNLERKKTLLDPGGMPDIIISNYHKLSGWAGELKGKIKAVVFDEAHELRRQDSQKYDAADTIAGSASLRLGLTATPIFNFGLEMRSVLEVLKPGALGDKAEFTTEWCGYGDNIKDPKAFGAYLREHGLMLRRTREDVGRELPGLTIVPHMIDADTSELDKIASSAAELARIVLSQGVRGFDKMDAAQELSWKLRQATGIAKAPYVADFVRLLVESGEKVLLAGWHRAVYDLWHDRLADLSPVFFTGEESPAQKEAAKQAFVNGDSKVLIMSLRSGAGIDGLQKVCSTVVYGEPDWSPAVHEQFTGRVHRDGQERPVVAYFLLADSGSDPVIADVLGLKRAQLEGIRDPFADVVQDSQTDPERVRRLAEDFLRQRGELTQPTLPDHHHSAAAPPGVA